MFLEQQAQLTTASKYLQMSSWNLNTANASSWHVPPVPHWGSAWWLQHLVVELGPARTATA